MNRSKRQMPNNLQKKMAKEIRVAQGPYPISETSQYGDELMAKEMLKKYPKKITSKGKAVKPLKKILLIKKKSSKINSKRTTPSLVNTGESPPAHIHPEGKRWIKTLIKQNQTKKVIQEHKGLGVSRKK